MACGTRQTSVTSPGVPNWDPSCTGDREQRSRTGTYRIYCTYPAYLTAVTTDHLISHTRSQRARAFPVLSNRVDAASRGLVEALAEDSRPSFELLGFAS